MANNLYFIENWEKTAKRAACISSIKHFWFCLFDFNIYLIFIYQHIENNKHIYKFIILLIVY